MGLLFKIRNAEMRIGRSMKFSALAILPSNVGRPKRIANTRVVKKAWDFLKIFLARRKKTQIDRIPKIAENNLIVNSKNIKNIK